MKMSKNDQECPCRKKSCPRHGNCAECRAHHENSKRQRPVACERKKKQRFSVHFPQFSKSINLHKFLLIVLLVYVKINI